MVYVVRKLRKGALLLVYCCFLIFTAVWKHNSLWPSDTVNQINAEIKANYKKRAFSVFRPVIVKIKEEVKVKPFRPPIRSSHLELPSNNFFIVEGVSGAGNNVKLKNAHAGLEESDQPSAFEKPRISDESYLRNENLNDDHITEKHFTKNINGKYSNTVKRGYMVDPKETKQIDVSDKHAMSEDIEEDIKAPTNHQKLDAKIQFGNDVSDTNEEQTLLENTEEEAKESFIDGASDTNIDPALSETMSHNIQHDNNEDRIQNLDKNSEDSNDIYEKNKNVVNAWYDMVTNRNKKKKKRKKEEVRREPFQLIDPRFSIDKFPPRAGFRFIRKPNRILDEPQCKISCFKNEDVKWTFIAMIESSPTNTDRRKLLRKTQNKLTYANGTRFINVFVLGRSLDESENSAVGEEAERHGDILQYDDIDSYENLSLKTLAILQWSSENLPPDFLVAKMDDDVAINPPRILKVINNLIEKANDKTESGGDNVLDNLPIICGSTTFDRAVPLRRIASKYYMNKQVYSLNVWPLSCAGQMYVMSVKLTGELYEISRSTELLALEDVWVTGVLRHKLGYDNSMVVASGYNLEKMLGVHASSTVTKLTNAKIVSAYLKQKSYFKVQNVCACYRESKDSDDQLDPSEAKNIHTL